LTYIFQGPNIRVFNSSKINKWRTFSMQIRACVLSTFALFFLLSAVVNERPALAATINFASGGGLTPPTFGSIQDPTVEVSVDGGVTWTQAYAADGPWPAPLAGPTWDSPVADPFAGFGIFQDIHYRITVGLNGFVPQALSGQFAGDDQVKTASLNGTEIANYPYGGYVFDDSPHAFGTTDSSLIVMGPNVVEFVILNLGGATGINFAGSFSGIQLPTNADQCRDGGWRTFGVFRNQGDCVSYVATHGRNPARG
jgi:hypothetical protein